jgi:hypothetical protein
LEHSICISPVLRSQCFSPQMNNWHGFFLIYVGKNQVLKEKPKKLINV